MMVEINKNGDTKNGNNNELLPSKEEKNGPLFNEEELNDLRQKRIEIFMEDLDISRPEAERLADENLRFYREDIAAFA